MTAVNILLHYSIRDETGYGRRVTGRNGAWRRRIAGGGTAGRGRSREGGGAGACDGGVTVAGRWPGGEGAGCAPWLSSRACRAAERGGREQGQGERAGVSAVRGRAASHGRRRA